MSGEGEGGRGVAQNAPFRSIKKRWRRKRWVFRKEVGRVGRGGREHEPAGSKRSFPEPYFFTYLPLRGTEALQCYEKSP